MNHPKKSAPTRQLMTQYSVAFPQHRDGLTQLTKLLADADLDVHGLVTASVGDETVVQFLAYKDPALRQRLEAVGLKVREHQVFEFEMPRCSCELHKLAQALADNGIRIISLHSAVTDDRIRMVMAVDEPANAMPIVAKLGFAPDYTVL